MTAKANSIDLSALMSEHLERAEPDLLRSMLKTFVEALMGAEADAICGAPYGARSEERVNSRNAYRGREWDTRVGTIEVGLPKLRSGSYFPDWLLEKRKRAERAYHRGGDLLPAGRLDDLDIFPSWIDAEWVPVAGDGSGNYYILTASPESTGTYFSSTRRPATIHSTTRSVQAFSLS